MGEGDSHLARRFRDEAAERCRIETMQSPERTFWDRGLVHVAGVDEAGRGPLAGPVVAAAVAFPPNVFLPGIDDSKRLTARQREALVPEIQRLALATGIGVAEADEVDAVNILNATHRAMSRAVAALGLAVNHVLVDGRGLHDPPWPQTAIVGGDRICFSIAAASILAKTHRDGLMVRWDAVYPEYGFAAHKGYGSLAHREAIQKHGPCPLHRRSFSWGEALP